MILRYVTLGLALAGIVVWLVYLVRCKDKWLYALAPLLWLLNVGAFWVYRMFMFHPGMSVEPVNDWSVGIYFQAMVTLIAVGLIAVKDKRRCY